MQKEALVVLGLFSRKSDADLELLPPPPPFPDIEQSTKSSKGQPAPKKEKAEKTKIVLKQKESVNDILAQTSSPHIGEPEDFLSMSLPKEEGNEVMLQDGDEISKAITDAKAPKQKKDGFWKRLFGFGKKQVAQTAPLPMELPSKSGQQECAMEEDAPLSPLEGVMKNVNKARQQLENLDVRSAKETYVEIMKLYRMMTQSEQEQVYEIIQELYEERKSAEKLPGK